MFSSEKQQVIRWNRQYPKWVEAFQQLYHDGLFTDATLWCEGKSVKCHRIVLSACSSYLNELLVENNCEHAILVFTDIKYEEMLAILEYVYHGEVTMSMDQLENFLEAAKKWKIEGLSTRKDKRTSRNLQQNNQTEHRDGDDYLIVKDCMREVAGTSSKFVDSKFQQRKGYKTYSNQSFNLALECVKNGLSALAAARKYNVPSRTLYDKISRIKKAKLQTPESSSQDS